MVSISKPGRRTNVFRPAADGRPPVQTVVRNAKLVTLPVAFAGRQAAGLGSRALGRSADEVQRDIQIRTAQHLFEVLGELKGAAAKLGQLMSLYEMALPPEFAEPYRTALGRLQDAAPAMLPRGVEAAMAASMGPDWQWYFRQFDSRRAAAASIGQVHRGVWRDGTPVAVKIMYPGARQAVRSDLEQLRRLSVLARVFLRGAEVEPVLEALCDAIDDELDFAAEAEYQRAFARAYAGSDDFRIPEVIEQRGDVLISEWLPGIPVTRLVDYGSPRERDRVGMLMVRFVTSGWGAHGLLYSDAHLGNFRVLPDGRLGVVDFGACSPFPPPGFDELAVDLCEAIFHGTPAMLEAAIRRHGFVEHGRDFDVDALAALLATGSEPVRHTSYRLSAGWLRELVLEVTTPRLSNVMRQLTAPAYLTPFARAALTLVAGLTQLETEGRFREEILRWVPALDGVLDRDAAAGC
ncbi:AarF/ABC1/UbiB kinase family protein [Nocardia sp. JMUB6875]|uniref:ABC1 kinase family protein n=1 Tax=Nocardia sp. JMUB6875 TaxID=3158170 RepID=UPI0032E69D0A